MPSLFCLSCHGRAKCPSHALSSLGTPPRTRPGLWVLALSLVTTTFHSNKGRMGHSHLRHPYSVLPLFKRLCLHTGVFNLHRGLRPFQVTNSFCPKLPGVCFRKWGQQLGSWKPWDDHKHLRGSHNSRKQPGPGCPGSAAKPAWGTHSGAQLVTADTIHTHIY